MTYVNLSPGHISYCKLQYGDLHNLSITYCRAHLHHFSIPIPPLGSWVPHRHMHPPYPPLILMIPPPLIRARGLQSQALIFGDPGRGRHRGWAGPSSLWHCCEGWGLNGGALSDTGPQAALSPTINTRRPTLPPSLPSSHPLAHAPDRVASYSCSWLSLRGEGLDSHAAHHSPHTGRTYHDESPRSEAGVHPAVLRSPRGGRIRSRCAERCVCIVMMMSDCVAWKADFAERD